MVSSGLSGSLAGVVHEPLRPGGSQGPRAGLMTRPSHDSEVCQGGLHEGGGGQEPAGGSLSGQVAVRGSEAGQAWTAGGRSQNAPPALQKGSVWPISQTGLLRRV